jgi:TonB family protein
MRFRVPSLLIAGLLSFAILAALNAQPPSDRPRKLTTKSFIEGESSAVDAKGVHHRGTDYAEKPPWINDAIKKLPPKYPYEQRARYIGGIGVVRVTLDLSTGNVSKTAMVRSTGVPALDNSALEGFRQWQWKPGKWKEIDVPVIFTKPGVVITPDGARVMLYDGRR